MAVQWLRLGTFTAKSQSSIPVQGTKIPQGKARKTKQKQTNKKTPQVAKYSQRKD